MLGSSCAGGSKQLSQIGCDSPIGRPDVAALTHCHALPQDEKGRHGANQHEGEVGAIEPSESPQENNVRAVSG